MKTFLAVIGGLLLIPFLIIYGAFVNGFLLYKAWIWYSPIIGSNVVISFHGAIAIMLIVGLFHQYSTKEDKDDDWKHMLTVGIVTPWLVLLILWGFTFIL